MRNNILKSSRSQGHVEMVLSFVIFAGFVAFLLLALNPQKYASVDYSALDTIQAAVLKNVTIEYSYTSVILEDGIFDSSVSGGSPVLSAGGCFSIDAPYGLSGNFAAFDSSGADAAASVSGGKMTIRAAGRERFYGIYSSAYFQLNAPVCTPTPLISDYYSLGILKKENAVFYGSLESFNNSYNNNYEGLKKTLGFTNDFSFNVRDEDQKIIFDGKTDIPQNINVISRDVLISTINKFGEKKNLILNLRAW